MDSRWKVLGLSVALFMGFAVGAVDASAATTVIAPGSPYPYQLWADEAMVPTPDVAVVVVADSTRCGEALACTEPGAGVIWLAPPPEMTVPQVRTTFLHEMGHQFDYVMPWWVRGRFRALIGDAREWRQGPNAPNEKFAEAWRICAEYGPRLNVELILPQGYDYRPTYRLQPHVCHLIQTAYRVARDYAASRAK